MAVNNVLFGGSDTHHSVPMLTTDLRRPPLGSGTNHSASTPTTRLQHSRLGSSARHSPPVLTTCVQSPPLISGARHSTSARFRKPSHTRGVAAKIVVFDGYSNHHWAPLAHHGTPAPTTRLPPSAPPPTTCLQRSPLASAATLNSIKILAYL